MFALAFQRVPGRRAASSRGMPPHSWRRCRHSLPARALQGPHAQPAAPSPDTPQVGHLLGLGDRHLDNMLLHRRGGHLLHIDFSVVFDRCAVWWWQALVRVLGRQNCCLRG